MADLTKDQKLGVIRRLLQISENELVVVCSCCVPTRFYPASDSGRLCTECMGTLVEEITQEELLDRLESKRFKQ